MTKTEIAKNYFANSFNCSQSVLCAFAPDLGMSKDASMKIASAFGGGIGRQQMTCGAVTSAIMALSLKYGKGIDDDDAKKLHAYDKTVSLINEFKKRHNSITCRELLDGLDMIADKETIKERHLFETKCVAYINDAVEIAEGLM